MSILLFCFDDFDAAERCECSPAVECRQWQPAASGGALIPEGRSIPVHTVPPMDSHSHPPGHKFMLVGQHDLREVPVESVSASSGSIRLRSQWCSLRLLLDAGGFPIVASAKVNPYALEEARYWSIRCYIRTNPIGHCERGSLVHFSLQRIHHRSSEWSWLAHLERRL